MKRAAAVLGFALAICGGSRALAQSDLQDTTPPAANTGRSPLGGTELQPFVSLGHDLLDAGILTRLRYVDSFASDPVGGLKQGVDNSGVVIFGTDLDLDRIAGVGGAAFHVSIAQFYGHELATDDIGTRTKVQSFYYPYKQFELTEFTYEQSFVEKRVDFLVGRSNATGEFARSTYGCRFENVADCPFELTQLVGGFPGFPYTNWGGRVRVAPTQYTFVKAGAYELNSVRNRNSGFDWDLTHSTGYVVPVEIGYETSFATDPMPRHFKLGGWYNSADYTDPYLNTKYLSRAQFGGAALTHSGGRTGFYALADQMVWRPDPTEQRGIAAFASAAAPNDANETFSLQAVTGAVWTGPFPSRPSDQIAVLGSYIKLSSKEENYLDGLLKKAKSPSLVPRDGFVVEVNYGYEIVAGLVIQPTVQYLIDPDDISRTSTKAAPRDALVLGLKLSLNANQLLGLPQSLSDVRLPAPSLQNCLSSRSM